jgi:valyl-tRNA synthetase
MIDKYGADALRFALLQQAGKNQDFRFSEDRIKQARFFCNKLWNASRFVLTGIAAARELREEQKESGTSPAVRKDSGNRLPHADLWIMSRLHRTIDAVNAAFAAYDMDEAMRAAYAFFWDDYCDWYIEMSKPRLREGGADSYVCELILTSALNAFLQLMHPVMPFITEEIWRKLPDEARTDPLPESLMFDHYPRASDEWIDPEVEDRMEVVLDTVRTLRNLRAELGIPPGPKLTAAVVPGCRKAAEVLSDNAHLIESLARLVTLQLRDAAPSGGGKWVGTPFKGAEAFLEIGDALDIPKERERIDRELGKIEADLARSKAKLQNAQFTERAPAEIVQKEQQFAADLEDKRTRLAARRSLLGE